MVNHQSLTEIINNSMQMRELKRKRRNFFYIPAALTASSMIYLIIACMMSNEINAWISPIFILSALTAICVGTHYISLSNFVVDDSILFDIAQSDGVENSTKAQIAEALSMDGFITYAILRKLVSDIEAKANKNEMLNLTGAKAILSSLKNEPQQEQI